MKATSEGSKEFGKVQRAAMLKASGCLSSTSTDALEVLANTIPIDIHLKLRQTQEVVRIAAKHNDCPLRTDFNDSTNSDRVHGSKPTIFQFLMCTRVFMGLIKEKGKIDIEDFKLTKEVRKRISESFCKIAT